MEDKKKVVLIVDEGRSVNPRLLAQLAAHEVVVLNSQEAESLYPAQKYQGPLLSEEWATPGKKSSRAKLAKKAKLKALQRAAFEGR